MICGIMICLTAYSLAAETQKAEPAVVDTFPDTWSASDALGRTLSTHEQAGPPRAGKYVGIFYFLWIGQHGTNGPYDISKILARDPQAMLAPDSPLWGPQGSFHHWGEPLFGYYLGDDEWVIARHAQMLCDAGIDVIIFDVTNQSIYPKVYQKICRVYRQLRRQGRKTPQLAFLCPFSEPRKVVNKLYTDLYKPGHYRELWFQWQGKPLILATRDKVDGPLRDFFTFRHPKVDYFSAPAGPDQWGWLEIYPQHLYKNSAGQPEQMPVGVAQNASGTRLSAFSEKNTRGRSWHAGRKDDRPDAVLYGRNFAEQWEHALQADPQFIFITGWNEWIAQRLPEFNGLREPVMFVDQYTQEYSRDIEPMRGGHGDNYYYQMIEYIRRFKGVRPGPRAGRPTTISIDAQFQDWAEVTPEYRDDVGDTMPRNHLGYDQAGRYVNRTGRNDIVLAKVARDEHNVHFYAQAAGPLTPRTGRHWMLLFIDADHDYQTGWEGFDLLVNRGAGKGQTASLERTAGGWNWKPVREVPCQADGRELELSVPRSLFGPKKAEQRLEFRFKWSDNMQAEGEVMDFTVNGDAAPNGRFCYSFQE